MSEKVYGITRNVLECQLHKYQVEDILEDSVPVVSVEELKKIIDEVFMGSSFESLPAKIMSLSFKQAYCSGCQDTEKVWEERVENLRKRLKRQVKKK